MIWDEWTEAEKSAALPALVENVTMTARREGQMRLTLDATPKYENLPSVSSTRGKVRNLEGLGSPWWIRTTDTSVNSRVLCR